MEAFWWDGNFLKGFVFLEFLCDSFNCKIQITRHWASFTSFLHLELAYISDDCE